jgi:hypothetical protein
MLRTASVQTHAVTTPRLRWLATRAHTNWPCQESYVPANESGTQARTEKNNVELQMNDYLTKVGVLQTEYQQNYS